MFKQAWNVPNVRNQRVALEQFLDVTDAPERSIVIANRTEPEPFQRMVENLFRHQEIEVDENNNEEYPENTVLLLEGNEIVATSSLAALQDAILLVNSDLFITGTRKLERTRVPAVLDGLAGTRFSLRGYPESNSEKLLLILISRYIERRAFEEGAGVLRSSFQRLSRLEDERGTRRVYERIAETNADVHLYGRPDWTPPPEFRVVVHGGYGFDFRTSWFVVHEPPAGSETEPAALLAIELDRRRWDGFWSYDPAFVTELTDYIKEKL